MGKVYLCGKVPKLMVPEPPVLWPADFSDATWAEIIEACQTNSVPDTWVPGDQKAVTINGKSYQIDIIGKNHDDYADGSGKAPLTFQMHDCYTETYMMQQYNSNSGGWHSSKMRTDFMPKVLKLMPSEMQAGIKKVNKVAAGTTSEDTLFLLSHIEVFGTTHAQGYSGEGSQYDYYKAGNSKVKNRNGSAEVWWLRSPSSNVGSYLKVVSSGASAEPTSSDGYCGVSVAFCF